MAMCSKAFLVGGFRFLRLHPSIPQAQQAQGQKRNQAFVQVRCGVAVARQSASGKEARLGTAESQTRSAGTLPEKTTAGGESGELMGEYFP